MGRGRKPISNFNGSEWENVFYNSVGTYVQYINIQLSKIYKLEPLSNHLKIIGGYAFKTAEYKNQGIPIIRISDFNNEQIVLKDVVYYQEVKGLDKYQLIAGDIIIALTGGTIAKLAIVQAGLGKIYLNQRVGKFQALEPDEFEVEYIYWLARSIQSIIKNLAWGAAIPNVSPKQIEELKFPFPPKETQRGIINFLNDLKNNNLKGNEIYFDEIIETEIISLQEKQLTTSSISSEFTHQLTLVKKLRQQLLQDAVQGNLVRQNPKDEPASEFLKKIKIEKGKLNAGKKLKNEKELPPIKPEEIPFDIPENWVWCRLGEIIESYQNGISSRGTSETTKAIVLRLADINNSMVDMSATREISLPVQIIEKHKLVESDILITRVNGSIELVGNFNYVGKHDVNITACDHFIRMRLFPSINAHFIYLLGKSKHIRKSIESQFKTTSGQKTINQGHINNLVIPFPPSLEQNRIIQKLDEVMQYCNDLEESIKKSAAQNEKLLQQVLREALRE